MPPKKSPTLTEAELRVMEVIWEKNSANVHQIRESLRPATPLAYNSVLTTIRILENKGYVKHVRDGRAYVYIPRMGRQEATRFEISNLVSRLFKNSHELLLLNLLEDSSIDSEDLKRVKEILQQGGGK